MTLKQVQWALAVVASMMIISGVRTADTSITLQRRDDSAIAAYQRVELQVGLDRHYSNPFDPDEIAVDAQITSPEGKTISIPAFWSKDYPETFPEQIKRMPADSGSPSFRVRFCPTSAGKWKVLVTAKDQAGVLTSSSLEMDVAPSSNRGFVHLSAVNHQYLQFDSGAAYFPVGLNLAWPDGKNPLQYVGWFKSLSDNGGNFARVWMCHPPVMIESERSGLGKYDLANAGYFDDLLELAEQNGIYLMLTFNNHRELLNQDMWGPAGWPGSPYNAANGGPATRPVDFFTDEAARKFFRHRLRYFIARYSSFTNMMCWELFNEQELARIHNLPDSWVAEMADYLRVNDPYHHLVSTSSDVPDSVWRLDGMSISQGHIYGDGEVVDLITPIVGAVKRHAQFNKPYLLAEFGISYKGPDTQYDPHNTATSFHNSLWAATMSGACGTAAYWWWDNYIDPHQLWPVYKSISKFAATVDWPKRQFVPIDLPPPVRARNEPETFSDLVLPSAGRWGKADPTPIVIAPSGQASAALPHYYYGPDKTELRTATTLFVELHSAGDMTLHINMVSDHSTLHITVDDKSTADLTFDAQPGGADQESTKMTEEPPKVYQAVINKDRIVPLTAGKHKIVIDNYAGDWITVDRITFANAKSSKSADLNALALQDASAGETLVWLFDGTSNWQSDRDGNPHREIDAVSLSVPVARAGTFEASWSDARRHGYSSGSSAGEGWYAVTDSAKIFARCGGSDRGQAGATPASPFPKRRRRRRGYSLRKRMNFPYGKAPLGILLLFLMATVGLVIGSVQQSAEPKPDLVFATFTKEHAAAYRLALPAFEAAHHCRVQLQVVDQSALKSRLQSAMQVGAEVPDMCELMDGFMSIFTKGMIEDVQLVDLTDKLHSTGMYDKLVTNRFSKWESRGHIFALPHDVHPAMLAYRKDIVEQLGIDVNKLTTWDAFCRVGRDVVTKSTDSDGNHNRYMLDLPTDGTDIVPLLALQHGGTLFDAAGNVTFDREPWVDVLCWYVKQIQGKDRISFPCAWGQNLAKAMNDGLVLFYFCPDWRTMQFQMDTPGLAGKMGLMPLPAWEPGGLRTSTWGATGLGFPKAGKNFELAWQLAMYLYYTPDQLGPRFLGTNILPPLKEAWKQPQFSQINDYWHVSIGQTYIPLATQVPANPSNAYYFEAVSKLSTAFTVASEYYDAHGDSGLREATQQQLKTSAEELRQMMRRNVFLNAGADAGGVR